MPRSALTDILQTYCFWLCDVAPIDGLSMPMLTPLFGFSSITAPEITVDFTEITEGNWYFKKKVIKGANVSNITLSRGATFYDSDFWRWTIAALSGDPGGQGFGPLKIGGTSPRRQLVLTQYMARPTLSGIAGSIAAGLLSGVISAGGAAIGGGGAAGIASAGVQNAAGAAFASMGFGPFEFQARLPAKAWILHGALPARYKAAGDFDASSGAISIQELELSIEMVEEIALTA